MAASEDRRLPSASSGLAVREAGEADLPCIVRVYNHYVVHGTALWRETPTDLEERRRWLRDRRPAHPVLIAEWAGRVAGYGAIGPFRAFPGYDRTGEHAVYVDPALHRRGVGRALLEALIRRGRAAGLDALIGAISADQPASLGLHAACGFREVGRLPGVGRKHGRRLDLVLVQLELGE